MTQRFTLIHQAFALLRGHPAACTPTDQGAQLQPFVTSAAHRCWRSLASSLELFNTLSAAREWDMLRAMLGSAMANLLLYIYSPLRCYWQNCMYVKIKVDHLHCFNKDSPTSDFSSDFLRKYSVSVPLCPGLETWPWPPAATVSEAT